MTDFTVTDRRHARGLPSVGDEPVAATTPAPEPVVTATVVTDEPASSELTVAEAATIMDPTPWPGWPSGWGTSWLGHGGTSWNSGIAALNDVAWNAIDLNSGIISTLPIYVQKPTGQRLDPETIGAPMWLENPEPLVYNSLADALRQAFWSYYAAGETYIHATAFGSDGYPSRWVVLHPAFVQAETIGGITRYSMGGHEFDPDELLHIRYAWTPLSPHGISPLEAAGARVVAAEMLTRYAGELAANGGLPMAVLTSPRRLTKKQSDDILVSWANARRSRLGLPAVLSDGVTLETPTAAIRDVALAELEKFSASRIANMLGVPPFLLGLPSGGDSMTYSNVSSLFDFHWRAHLRPKSSLFFGALSSWLLPRGTRLLVDRDDYVRPGWQELTQGYGSLLNAEVLTGDEVRADLGYQPGAPRDRAPEPTDDGSAEAQRKAAEVKAQADAMGALIRAGVVPEVAATTVGLTGIRFTGAIPTTLRPLATEAAQLEGGDTPAPSTAPAPPAAPGTDPAPTED